MAKYIALFETDPEADGVGVVFPDIPGCVSSGKNYEEAYRNAHEILAFFLEDLEAAGKKAPTPRTLEQIKSEWEDWTEWEKKYSFVTGFVTYYPTCKPKKYTLYLDSALMARVDEVSKNRSAFFTEAIRSLLDSEHVAGEL